MKRSDWGQKGRKHESTKARKRKGRYGGLKGRNFHNRRSTTCGTNGLRETAA
ncbi:MAG: hypothetical protein LBG15_04700 [Dysgonamonadaceae bacterium]|jgi:hypothetical protein|nr:hypothetical protein [Dysgonamonadaceae bacterium]